MGVRCHLLECREELFLHSLDVVLDLLGPLLGHPPGKDLESSLSGAEAHALAITGEDR